MTRCGRLFLFFCGFARMTGFGGTISFAPQEKHPQEVSYKMKIVILDADSIGRDLDYAALERFGEVTLWPSTSPAQLCGRIADAECLLLNKVKITADALHSAQRLRLICIAATGYDNVDIAACHARGIAVTNVRGYSTRSVAQLTAAMVLSLASRLSEYTAFVNSGDYSASGLPNRLTPVWHEIAGKTWGLLGYGEIARNVASVAGAMGCNVIFCRKTPSDDPACVDIDTLCRQSDILTVHLPLTEETRGILSAVRIAEMKPGALLVNVARGAVIDEQAAADAVLSGRLGGFGCDVYTTEPFPAEHPYTALLGHPRVLLTPHMAWGTAEARTRLLSEIGENIAAFLKGERRNRVEI